MKEDAVCKTDAGANPRKFFYNCENFVGIAKISLGLRKFRNHSENFAILAKLESFTRLAKLENFARLAKFR